MPAGDPRAAIEWCRGFGDTSGAVAIRRGEIVAFMLGDVGDHPIFGRNAWVERPGHAAIDPDALRELYAFLAERWVAAGVERHYVLVPALAEDLDPWHRLGFHYMHVEAIRESGYGPVTLPRGVMIRSGTADDFDRAASIDALIAEQQELTPSFSRVAIDHDARRRGWLETNLHEPGTTYLVAERGGQIIGHAFLRRPEPEFGVPTDAVYLASVAVEPADRGTGVGVALTAYALDRARETGYSTVVTNWRMTNLLASRFWPARGFRPVYHRLHRAVGTA